MIEKVAQESIDLAVRVLAVTVQQTVLRLQNQIVPCLALQFRDISFRKSVCRSMPKGSAVLMNRLRMPMRMTVNGDRTGDNDKRDQRD
jgi:hypothetical protein